jgi:protein-S-isoprenylcysteine O-methyltransferase Ste14
MENLIKYRPPRIALLLMAISFAIWRFSPDATIFYIPFKYIGCFGITCGFVTMMGAWFQFRKHKTAICPTAPTTHFITNGAYRISRNPMYLGMLLMLAGTAFIIGAVQPFLAPVAFFLIMDKVFIPYEEEKLLNEYENQYADYMNRTRRWL